MGVSGSLRVARKLQRETQRRVGENLVRIVRCYRFLFGRFGAAC